MLKERSIRMLFDLLSEQTAHSCKKNETKEKKRSFTLIYNKVILKYTHTHERTHNRANGKTSRKRKKRINK